MLEKKTVSQCISSDYCRGWNDAVDEMPRWISVKERLPEERLCVSVYIQEDGGAYWIETAFRRDGKWRIQGEYVIDRNITHWMHLPEPPKEE